MMDALEFVKELKRMCNSYKTCHKCGLNDRGFRLCEIEELEKAIPIVEQWSAEHPKVTNLDHVAEELARVGYEVDKEWLQENCPVYKSKLFKNEMCRGSNCEVCRKWWDEEFKEQKK